MNEDTTMIKHKGTKPMMPSFWIAMSTTKTICVHQFHVIYMSINKLSFHDTRIQVLKFNIQCILYNEEKLIFK